MTLHTLIIEKLINSLTGGFSQIQSQFTSPTLFNPEKICSSAYSEDRRCQIVFHTEAIGSNSEEIARTSGSCHGDLTHGRGALALAYAKKDANPNT